jgi:SAM-dependent methyltransferase
MADASDPSDLVRQGYNSMAPAYLAARSQGLADPPLLDEFAGLLPEGALVLDAGCGAGVPVTQFLAQRHRVVGIDFSILQVRLASRLVPEARLACLDMTRLAFRPGVFDGVCSFFAILHIPRARHRALIEGLHRVLRPGGWFLLCLGASDTQAAYGPYFGTRMYWSHFDSGEYLRMLEAAGLEVKRSEICPDPISRIASHLFVLGRKDGA